MENHAEKVRLKISYSISIIDKMFTFYFKLKFVERLLKEHKQMDLLEEYHRSEFLSTRSERKLGGVIYSHLFNDHRSRPTNKEIELICNKFYTVFQKIVSSFNFISFVNII